MSLCSCGYDWAGPASLAATTVRDYPARLAALLHDTGTSDDTGRLRSRPAPHVWSPLEYIAHTGDAITWYAGRVTRLLAEQRPVLEPFDWDSHTETERYHERHLDAVLAEVGEACAGFWAVVAGLTDEGWRRVGVGSDGSPRTVDQLVSRAAHEAHHHLLDVDRRLADAGCAPV